MGIDFWPAFIWEGTKLDKQAICTLAPRRAQGLSHSRWDSKKSGGATLTEHAHGTAMQSHPQRALLAGLSLCKQQPQ